VEEDWRKMRPSDWEVQQTLDEDDNGAFKTMKDVVGKGIRKYLSLYSCRLPMNTNGRAMQVARSLQRLEWRISPQPWLPTCPLHYPNPLFPEEAATVDVALHGWRLQPVEEARSWDF
jgi:hypothetical protein